MFLPKSYPSKAHFVFKLTKKTAILIKKGDLVQSSWSKFILGKTSAKVLLLTLGLIGGAVALSLHFYLHAHAYIYIPLGGAGGAIALASGLWIVADMLKSICSYLFQKHSTKAKKKEILSPEELSNELIKDEVVLKLLTMCPAMDYNDIDNLLIKRVLSPTTEPFFKNDIAPLSVQHVLEEAAKVDRETCNQLRAKFLTLANELYERASTFPFNKELTERAAAEILIIACRCGNVGTRSHASVITNAEELERLVKNNEMSGELVDYAKAIEQANQ